MAGPAVGGRWSSTCSGRSTAGRSTPTPGCGSPVSWPHRCRSSGRAEAARRATDAARIAEQKGRVHWAAAAWLWVARLDRRVDPAAALDAAGRAADLVPHRAEPWVERALVHLWPG